MAGFFEGGAKSLSFGKQGDSTMRGVWQGGKIINIGEPRQATDFTTGELKFWPKSNDPVIQIAITVDTRAGQFPAAPIDAEDDGVRDMYVTKGKSDFQAVRSALKKASAKDLAVGGELYMVWTSGEGQVGDPRKKDAAYLPPAPGTGGMFDEPAGQPAAPTFPAQVPPQQPVAQQAPSFPAQQPAVQAPAASPAPYGYNPQTGQPNPAPAQQAAPAGFDPVTGQPLAQQPTAPAQPAPGGVVNPYAQR